MLSFLIPLVFATIFLLLTIVFALISCIKNGEDKNSNRATLFSALASLSMLFSTHIPKPEIFISDNTTATNENEIIIVINSDNRIFKTYYSLDGTNPKNGIEYEKEIYISNPTTIHAKNKFLFLWSETEKESFLYERLYIESGKEFSIPINQNENKISTAATVTSDIITAPTPQATVAPDIITTPTPQSTNKIKTTKDSIKIVKGLNPNEGYKLMTYINNHRKKNNISNLKWSSNLEKKAKKIAAAFAKGKNISGTYSYLIIGRQCNGAKNAKKAVSDWMTGNTYIPSESKDLLNTDFTEIGGALYYLPKGNKYNYHYFWIVCLK